MQILPQFAQAERKNKLLRSVAGGGVEQMGDLRSRWDKFELMMESHQLMIQDQVQPTHMDRSCHNVSHIYREATEGGIFLLHTVFVGQKFRQGT